MRINAGNYEVGSGLRGRHQCRPAARPPRMLAVGFSWLRLSMPEEICTATMSYLQLPRSQWSFEMDALAIGSRGDTTVDGRFSAGRSMK